jgi:hypothetical protein
MSGRLPLPSPVDLPPPVANPTGNIDSRLVAQAFASEQGGVDTVFIPGPPVRRGGHVPGAVQPPGPDLPGERIVAAPAAAGTTTKEPVPVMPSTAGLASGNATRAPVSPESSQHAPSSPPQPAPAPEPRPGVILMRLGDIKIGSLIADSATGGPPHVLGRVVKWNVSGAKAAGKALRRRIVIEVEEENA